ncbi:cell division protein FtsZ [Endomicrobiia bacterium]|nr:cell division protein FtsZ [Endomicrobiia bacterium]GHT64093.1 cell division protein FtsZ [Endomicrobiia bacterium]GHT70480.1 cell division protein FtsZ [Endomicrobiia bacterium]GHT74169.1 cell division protein FtsZ [Endomicrobiia bacterium]
MSIKIVLPSKEMNTGQPAVIRIMGVGGGGCNAINRMIAANVGNVEFVSINTDAQALLKSSAPDILQIGEKITKGLGVGGNPEVGKQAAEESIEEIKGRIIGADMIFVTAGMGGGTGTGVAPIVAKLAREIGILTIGVVTKPFEHEGKVRMAQAEEGIKNLKEYTDALIIIPNERVFNVINERVALDAFYQIIDDVLRQSIQAITDIVTVTGEINRDFADVRSILTNAGTALIGIGESTSVDVKEAVRKAVTSPLLENYDISKAKKALVNITTNSNISALTLQEIFGYIKSYGINGHVFFGHTIDNRLDDKIKITIIATGFKNDEPDVAMVIEEPQPEFFSQQSLSVAEETDPSKPAYTYWKPRFLK